MGSSSPRGTPDTDDNASLAQTVSDPSNTATMAPDTLVVELQLHSEEAIERFAEIVQDDNAPHQLAFRNQTDFVTRSINRAARMDSHNAASGRGRGRETDNGNNEINRFSGTRNCHTLHHGVTVNTGLSLNQPLDNQPHRANGVYDEPQGFGGQNNRFAAERDEGAYSEGGSDRQPSSPPPASTSSANINGCAARSKARQHTALSQTGRCSPVVVNTPHLVLRPNRSPNTTHRRLVAGQSARQTQAPLTRPRDAYNDVADVGGGMSMMHGSYGVYDEIYNNNRVAIPRPSLTFRGHARSSAPRLQCPPAGVSGIRRTTQSSTRPVYVPHYERERTSRNAAPESSRAAAARIARQRQFVMQSTENDTRGPVVAESEYADDDAGSDDDEPDESMGAQWRRSKEDEKTPILKRLGVVCEHVANCNTNSPFRKGISTFFGRNKTCIRDIPEEILVHFCRKHYQRCKFRDPVGWTRKQCEMITEQFDRIELWSNNNQANGVGAVVTHWTIELRKREAEKQSAKKKTTAATKKSSPNRNGKGKAPADSDDNDDDQEPSDGSPPNWMVPYIGQPLTFAQLRKIFDRLSREVLAIKTRKLPEIEFLPVINWIGGAKPAIVRYKKRASASKPAKTPAKNSATKGKNKAKSTAVEAGKDDDYVDEDFEDVMADSNEFYNGRKRKHDAEDDDDSECHSRARRA